MQREDCGQELVNPGTWHLSSSDKSSHLRFGGWREIKTEASSLGRERRPRESAEKSSVLRPQQFVHDLCLLSNGKSLMGAGLHTDLCSGVIVWQAGGTDVLLSQ